MWFFPKILFHPIFTIWFNFITLGWFCSIQLILPVFLYLKMCENIANYQFNNSIDFLLRFWCLHILIFFRDPGASYSDFLLRFQCLRIRLRFTFSTLSSSTFFALGFQLRFKISASVHVLPVFLFSVWS